MPPKLLMLAHLVFTASPREEQTMLKTFAVALLATAMSVGLAQAKGHMHKGMIPGCAEGQRAAATCSCGTAANGQPLLCQKGQWCHSFIFHTCT
jgi:hypothetical protein